MIHRQTLVPDSSLQPFDTEVAVVKEEPQTALTLPKA
ncbi:BgTH12-05839 [Blumeria graminis f. sp. triticale]|uniref:Bgt-51319 n=2 Tax=Blumeria graminis TaxID=34373 RepID=A0A9X9QED8_BLUGR|nr:BgTH12-05839 [Blumeria graminis f. sp. triticale]VDB90847.1 Bgt-51319 [Blumeria graminis f. sp. tritici]